MPSSRTLCLGFVYIVVGSWDHQFLLLNHAFHFDETLHAYPILVSALSNLLWKKKAGLMIGDGPKERFENKDKSFKFLRQSRKKTVTWHHFLELSLFPCHAPSLLLLHQSSTLLLYRAQKQLKLFFIIYLFFTSNVIIKAGIKSQPPQQPT